MTNDENLIYLLGS